MKEKDFLSRLKLESYCHVNRFCFILGAGASKECGVPDAGDLIKEWYKALLQESSIPDLWKQILEKEDAEAKDETIERLKSDPELLKGVLKPMSWEREEELSLARLIRLKFTLDDEEKYARMFELRFPTPTLRRHVIDEFVAKGSPKEGHKRLADVLLNTSNNIVITTNFDEIIEKAVRQRSSLMLMSSAEAPNCGAFEDESNNLAPSFMDLNNEKPLVIKAHGDISGNVQKNTVEELRHLPESFCQKMESIFSTYIPIFIGYAGTDAALVDMLIAYAHKNGRRWNNADYGCYWLVYGREDESPEAKVSSRVKEYVRSVNGKYIIHSGFEDIMPKIADMLLGAAGNASDGNEKKQEEEKNTTKDKKNEGGDTWESEKKGNWNYKNIGY